MMSGGRFDYKQYDLRNIAETIKLYIDKNGKEKTKRELDNWYDDEWLKKYPEDKYHHKYSDEVIEEFKKGIEILHKAEIYVNRIDYLLSGDDDEESFLRRLKEELK